MRLLLLLAALLVCAASAGPKADLRPPCTARTPCKLKGVLHFDAGRRELLLELANDACQLETVVRMRDASGRPRVRREMCSPFPNKDWSGVTLVTPWQEELAAYAPGPNQLAFRVDFARSDVDPLAPDIEAKLARPWEIRVKGGDKQMWMPSPEERTALLAQASSDLKIETYVGEVTGQPNLVVQDLSVKGELRNGAGAHLVLSVGNTGQGAAYRLVVRTRSNIPALHGLQFSFGRLAPGESEVREVRVALPGDNDEPQAVVVLVFEEAHQFAPEPVTRRFAVKPAAVSARLSMTCRLLGVDGARPHVDAGQTVHVECRVRNDGARARRVRVSAELAGVPGKVETEPFDLDTSRMVTTTSTLVVPKGATLDSELPLNMRVRHEDSKQVETVTITLVIARQKICPNGKLTRDQFAAKRKELKRTLDDGLITQEQYETYEAELVGCLE